MFGGLSVYLSNFLIEINKSPEMSQKIVIKSGILSINFLEYGIGCSILIMILISIVLLRRAFDAPKNQIPIIYLTGWSAIERIAFTIPFLILVIGLSGYIYNFYYNELNLTFSGIFFLYGFVGYFAILFAIRKRYHLTAKIFFLAVIGIWIVAGIAATISISMKEIPIISNPLYSFAIGMAQGVIPGILASIAFWIIEWNKNRKQKNLVLSEIDS